MFTVNISVTLDASGAMIIINKQTNNRITLKTEDKISYYRFECAKALKEIYVYILPLYYTQIYNIIIEVSY